jgi:tetratricopeptide (TPR) repeat protein
MKRYIIFIALILVTGGCGKRDIPQAVKGEAPLPIRLSPEAAAQAEARERELQRRETDKTTLQYNYDLFRLNRMRFREVPYTVTNDEFFSALKEEFETYALSREDNLRKAIRRYSVLIDSYPSERWFLVQRVGICHFKLKDYAQANKFISAALRSGFSNDEIRYYKSMLRAYYRKDLEGALHYVKRVNPVSAYLDRQDYLYYVGSLYLDLGDRNEAKKYFENALSLHPGRFYIHYDILNFYLDGGLNNEARVYAQNSFDYLMSLEESEYRKKAYSQMVLLNELTGRPTFRYRFNIQPQFDHFGNIFYFTPSTRLIQRARSSHVELPVAERRQDRRDLIFYPLYEDMTEFNGKTGYVVIAGLPAITNARYEGNPLFTPKSKIFTSSNIIMLIRPTNAYYYITNTNLPPVSPNYIVTNHSNAIFTEVLDIKFYHETLKYNLDGGKYWDYIIIGYDGTNVVTVTFFYPSRLETEKLSFMLNKHNAEIIIQDFKGNGENEIILIDDDVYYLKPEDIVIANR